MIGLINTIADWPIAEQDTVRLESQTENDGLRKGGVRRVATRCRGNRRMCHANKGTTMGQSINKEHGLT